MPAVGARASKQYRGEDVVVLRIAGGPTLVLHPEHARDLMLAQQGEARTKRRERGETVDDVRAVSVPAQLRWRGIEEGVPMPARHGASWAMSFSPAWK